METPTHPQEAGRRAAAVPVRITSHAHRPRLAEIRRRILDATARGATEVATAALGDAARRALQADGFAVAAVAGEDGPYSVIYW